MPKTQDSMLPTATRRADKPTFFGFTPKKITKTLIWRQTRYPQSQKKKTPSLSLTLPAALRLCIADFILTWNTNCAFTSFNLLDNRFAYGKA